MSTHVLDASGARPLTSTINDPAATRAQVHAKAGDDVAFQIGAAREIRVAIPPGAKIERREHVHRVMRRGEGGVPTRDAKGDVEYDEKPYDVLYLVVPSGLTVFARSSFVEPPAEGEHAYESTPHTTLFVRRNGADLHLSEQGTLLEELDLTGYLPRSMADGQQ